MQNDKTFFYFLSANVDDPDISSLEIFEKVRALHEIKIKSKMFDDYKECLDTVNLLMSDVVVELRKKDRPFTFFVDENPKFREDQQSEPAKMKGIGALSSWHDYEMMRYYLVDDEKSNEGVFITKFVISVLAINNNHNHAEEEQG